MYHFFKKCPIYNKKTGKEIPIPKEDGYRYKYAFINEHIITYDIASESRFLPETRNMKYLGCGEILYQHTKIVPDNEEERSYAKVIISARKFGISNFMIAIMKQVSGTIYSTAILLKIIPYYMDLCPIRACAFTKYKLSLMTGTRTNHFREILPFGCMLSVDVTEDRKHILTFVTVS